MISSQTTGGSFSAVRASFASFELLHRLDRQDAEIRRRVDASASSSVEGQKLGVSNIAYAIAHDGRIYAVDASITSARRIYTPPLPSRTGAGVFEDIPARQGGSIPAGDLFASLIRLSPVQMAELFGEKEAQTAPQEDRSATARRYFEARADEAEEEQVFYVLPSNDNLQSATTAEPVRAAQYVSSLAKFIHDQVPEPVRAKAATSVASFYAALGNAASVRQNLIDIAA